MTKWLDPIEAGRAELQLENQRFRQRAEEAEGARDLWQARAEDFAEQLRQAQQAMAAMRARNDARFARHSSRSGE